MANNNGPNGFRAVTRLDGAPVNAGLTTAFVLNATGAIFYGDPVLITNGFISQAAVVPGGQQIAGVMQNHAFWVSKTFGRSVYNGYWPGTADAAAGTNITVKLQTDPLTVFEVQANGDSAAPIAQASVGKFFNYNAGGGGNTANGISSYTLDDNTVSSVQGNLPFKLQAVDLQPITDPTSAFNRVRVLFSNLNQGV